MDNFVFISYKSDDREQIRPYLQLLADNGIKYWWDQNISQDWGREIDRKLDECSAVVGFMTESSLQSDAVYAEFETGKSLGKLLPVKLDPARPLYHFRTVIGSLSWIDLTNESSDRQNEEKRRLVARLLESLGDGSLSEAADSKHSEPDLENWENWLQAGDRKVHLAYIIALCVFEGYNHDFIQDCTAELERELAEAGLDEMLGLNRKLVTRKSKFESIGARARQYRSRITGSRVDSVVFVNSLFGEKFFLYAWEELDQLKYPIVKWMNRMLESRPADCVGDIAVMLSLIGRRNFQSIYGLILRPWLNRTWSWHFTCADITLSLLMDDPGIKKFITGELLQVAMQTGEKAEISKPESPDDPMSPGNGESAIPSGEDEAAEFAQRLPRKSAVALVTGYTGMRIPDLSVALFKRIEGEFETDSPALTSATLLEIHRGIDRLLQRAQTDAYAQSLPAVFAKGLYDWMMEERKTTLPEYIFLQLLRRLTLANGIHSSVYGAGITDLLADGADLERRSLDTFSRTIAAGFECRNRFIRDSYIQWVKDWKTQLHEKESARYRESEKRVFREIFDAAQRHASTPDDVDRIRYHAKLN